MTDSKIEELFRDPHPLTEALEHLVFCMDKLATAQDLNNADTIRIIRIRKELFSVKQTIGVLLETVEKPGHLGYTSEDGEDFENQEVDRMCDDMIAKHEEDSDAYLNAEGLL